MARSGVTHVGSRWHSPDAGAPLFGDREQVRGDDRLALVGARPRVAIVGERRLRDVALHTRLLERLACGCLRAPLTRLDVPLRERPALPLRRPHEQQLDGVGDAAVTDRSHDRARRSCGFASMTTL